MATRPTLDLRRHPIAASLALTFLLAVALVLLSLALPLDVKGEHAALHLAIAVPVLILLALALTVWPPFPSGRATRVGRALFLFGLAVYGGGLVIEAVGAFGYEASGENTTNDLVVAHDVGLVVVPTGLVLALLGAIIVLGVAAAAQSGTAGSRRVKVVVVGAVVLFVALAIIRIFELF